MEKIKFHKVPKNQQVEDFIGRKFFWKPYFGTESYLEGILEFRELLKEILVRIWDKIEPEVEKIETVKLVSSNFACPVRYPHEPAKEGVCWPDTWVIVLHGSLAELLSNGSPEWREFVKYEICHQFCRFYLKRDELCKEDAVVSANNLARLWGLTTIEPTSPEENRTVWAMIHELKEPEERLDECYERLMEEGLVRKFKQAGKKVENDSTPPR